MASRDEHDHQKEPHHPAVLKRLLSDDDSGRLAHALGRSPDRHRALIRLVAGVLVAGALYELWRWVS
jgi:hypothetical protein